LSAPGRFLVVCLGLSYNAPGYIHRMQIETLFNYSDNCRQLLADTLRQYPEELHATFTTTSQFDSIGRLLAHSIGAEERCVTMLIQGKPIPVMYEARAADTLDGLIEDAAAIRAETRRFLSTLTAEDYLQKITISRGAARGLVLTVEEILFHVINHENYHRGQIVTALQRRGIDPPNFDYILLRG